MESDANDTGPPLQDRSAVGRRAGLRKLTDSLSRQLHLNSGKNLLYAEVSRLMEMEPTFLAAIETMTAIDTCERAEVQVDQLIRTVVESVVTRVYQINQYVQIGQTARAALMDVYRGTWRRIRSGTDILSALRDHHYPEIRKWVGDLYPESFRAALSAQVRVGNVVCQEYSAAFQLDLYGLELQGIRQPVLDVGCGKKGLLVSYLRSRGIEAYGVDRTVESSKAFLQAKDWLDDSDAQGQWGTIISNMAFTNHYRYVLQHDTERKPVYQSRFMNLLASLQKSGSFYYGPDAPELESLVDPNMYHVETTRIGRPFGTTRITRNAE